MKNTSRLHFIWMAVIIALPPVTGCKIGDQLKTDSGIPIGKSTRTIESGNQVRSYTLYVPKGYDGNTPLPLVLNFHGSGSTPDGQAGVSAFNRLADRKSFIVAMPAGAYKLGSRNSWNTNLDPEGVNDVKFVRDLIKEIGSKLSIDRKRIYATGFSGGARMSSRLACGLSNIIAAVAPVAGLLYYDDCTPVRAVPIITFHGKKDNVNHYTRSRYSPAYWIKGVEDSVKGWVAQDKCGAKPVIERISAEVEKRTYRKCSDKAEIVFYVIRSSGHTWPGSPIAAILERFGLGKTNMEINASELIWSFFETHPMP